MSIIFLFVAVSLMVVMVGSLIYFVLRKDERGAAREGFDEQWVAGGESPTEVPADLFGQRGESMVGTAVENGVPEADLQIEPQHGLWEDRNYCWVVLCKNHWFHLRGQNWGYRYRIALGEADAVSPPPALKGAFQVRCDSCGQEYLYKPSDVMRYETDLPESFRPHPLFD